MSWTANLLSVEKKNGMVYATVRYDSTTQGDAAIEQNLMADTLDADAIKLHTTVKVNSLNKTDASYVSAKALPLGPIEIVALPQTPFVLGK